METPKTEAGRRTELILAEVHRKIPNLSVNDHNRIWEACLTVLTAEDKKYAEYLNNALGEFDVSFRKKPKFIQT